MDKPANAKCSPGADVLTDEILHHFSLACGGPRPEFALASDTCAGITQFTIALNFESSRSTLPLTGRPFRADPGPLEAAGRRAYSPPARENRPGRLPRGFAAR